MTEPLPVDILITSKRKRVKAMKRVQVLRGLRLSRQQEASSKDVL